jgi:eukaryotic-like serine/threonine-protein kinase
MFGAPASFESDRFAIRRVIGTGGMGIVYEAWDLERDQAVALKTIRRLNASEVYHLEREFRALSDVSHPNLVSLYELVVDGTQPFFRMELVDGIDVVQACTHRRQPCDLPACAMSSARSPAA